MFMFRKRIDKIRRGAGLLAVALATTLTAVPALAQPTSVSYQGHLLRNEIPFDGTAQFKFAVIQGGAAYWSNDGSSAVGEEPDTSVPVSVDQGLFNVMLGAPPMTALTTDGIGGLTAPSLRIWVDTGSGFELLPDQPIASSAYALHSESAERSIGGFTAAGIIHSTTGGFRFPDGSVQTTAAVGGGAGGTLDQAYDFGGPGAGRTITADAGAVSIQGADGLRVGGSIELGATSPTPTARISVKNVGANDTTKLLSFDEGTGDEFYLQSGFLGTGSTGNYLSLNTAWTPAAMVLRGDGHLGFGTGSPNARLTVFHNEGGTESPGIAIANIASTGVALTALTVGSGPTATLTQAGTGDLLQLTPPTGSIATRIDNGGRLRLSANFGTGVAGAPVYSENTATSGVAFWGKVTGGDATAVLEQNGSGSLIRAFKSGVLKFEVQNSGRVVTTALQITGGGDLAEPFTIAGGPARPGSVVVIDEAHAGCLALSRRSYDHRVAGIVSGAGGLDPGITLTPESHQTGGQQVALTGRVYALADASRGAIRPGDLLTTSDVPGHVMKAVDPLRTPGSVLGKAMTALESGRGQVLVLVSLQ